MKKLAITLAAFLFIAGAAMAQDNKKAKPAGAEAKPSTAAAQPAADKKTPPRVSETKPAPAAKKNTTTTRRRAFPAVKVKPAPKQARVEQPTTK